MKKSDISRWEFSKSKSSYHFDHFKNEDNAPPYKILGHVKGDLVSEFYELAKTEMTVPNSFVNRLQHNSKIEVKPFTLDYDLNELERLGLPSDYSFFDILPIKRSTFFQEVANSFGMTDIGCRIHIQKPGQIFPYHIDEIPGLKKNDPNHWLDQKPELAARFEIQIFDWVPGHVWSYGNTYWKQWRSGEIAYHEWRHIPHGTANISGNIRASFQVTGFVTDKTRDILNNGYLSAMPLK